MEDVEDSWEESEDKPPETTDVDLENGIFNLVITLVNYYSNQGRTKSQACEQAALYLQTVADALQKITI